MTCLIQATGNIAPLLAYLGIMIALYPWVWRYSERTWKFSKVLELLSTHLVWVPIISLLTIVLLLIYVWWPNTVLFKTCIVFVCATAGIAFFCAVPILLSLNFASVRNWLLLRNIGYEQQKFVRCPQIWVLTNLQACVSMKVRSEPDLCQRRSSFGPSKGGLPFY